MMIPAPRFGSGVIAGSIPAGVSRRAETRRRIAGSLLRGVRGGILARDVCAAGAAWSLFVTAGCGGGDIPVGGGTGGFSSIVADPASTCERGLRSRSSSTRGRRMSPRVYPEFRIPTKND